MDLDDPDFIEFEFSSFEEAMRAEKAFPSDAVNLGDSLALRAGDVERLGDPIREKLRVLGLTWREKPSSWGEEDVYPEFDGEYDDEAGGLHP